MLLKNKDVLVALSIVLLNVVLLLLSFPVFWISIVITLPMVFFVPGYMFTEMLTHARELDIFHRLTLSLGLSLTLDILSGFISSRVTRSIVDSSTELSHAVIRARRSLF